MGTAPRTTLTFLGAAGTVTGSKYLLTIGDRRILIDSGMFQGEKKWRLKNWEQFPIEPASISDIVLTHAHLDHVGFLPVLTRSGFTGPIWCTEGTRQLAEIVLRDAAKLQEQEAEDANTYGYSKHERALPLYTTADVESMLGQFVALEYDADFELTGNERPGFTADPDETITIRLTRAGHILGSASVNVWTPTASVLFSGDLGRREHPVLKAREVPREGAPFVLVESTYGDRDHPVPVNLPHEGFADVIRRTIGRGGTVLVPAFAIDRTEVVLKTISDFERDGRIPDIPVYVNSPMGTRALRVYQSLTEELREDLSPSEFVNIPDLTAVESSEDSRRLTGPGGHGPCVIISSSGMATGGRVLHHLEELLPDPKNAVVLTGYQAAGTRGRQLSDGADQLKLRGKYVPVRAEVFHDREFSVHADRGDIMSWLAALDPKPSQVFCVHGETDSAAALAVRIKDELGVQVITPRHGEVVLLDAAELPAPTGVRARMTEPVAQAPRQEVFGWFGYAPLPTGSLPDGRPSYRLITGRPGDDFDEAVSAAMREGYAPHLAPVLVATSDGITVAQAVTWQGPWGQ
ncbi:MAG: MBL fold metallo-hydrolase [Propioniciclava sp.]|uniref:MBL fold metallo-hydrolase RNA specificity domain-containing protein n=1 Tax=Propioniciclava sp. TaxID=2038686 RepID=UPI0039E6B7F0